MKRQMRCACCRRPFIPNPHARKGGKVTQIVCHRKRCRKRRAQRARNRWWAENPDYLEGRYPKTRAWLQKHPGYLRAYRAAHPDYVAADNAKRRWRKLDQKRRRADIQDGLRRREIARIRSLRGADIQDTLRLRLDGVLDLLAVPARADIQDAIVSADSASLPSGP